ncbi:MAG: EpsI family protein [Phycisphaera sp.]|nr:EpsI family protein [Phycisphaera sp.]
MSRSPNQPDHAADIAAAEAKVREVESHDDVRQRAGGGPSLLGLLLTLVLLGVGWWQTFVAMWLRWYPGWDSRWDKYNHSFMQRFSDGDSYYSHGPLVPLTCLLMAFVIYRRLGSPSSRSRSSSVVGYLVLIGALLLQLMSVLARVDFSSGFALVGVIGGLVLLWGGWPLLRAYWLPVLFLVFMVPLPMETIANLNFELKELASRAAVWLTNYVFGIPSFLSGSVVSLPPYPDGSVKTLVVENVCGGLRSLISLIWFAAMFAMICRARGGWRVLMLLLAVPVAIGCNIVRITALNVGAHHWGTDAVAAGSTYHDMSGLLVYALALATLFGVEGLIVWGGKLLKRPWSDNKLMGYLDNIHGSPGAVPRFGRVVPILSIACVAGLSWMLAKPEVADMHRGTYASQAVPKDITIDGVPYVGEDFELDERSQVILETNDYLCRTYTPVNKSQGLSFNLLIVYSQDNRKGTHPPEVCLEGGGARVVEKSIHTITTQRLGKTKLRELVTEESGQRDFHLYTYKCANRYTPSFWVQQATIFLDSLLGNKPSGALIRMSRPYTDADAERTRQTIIDAATVIMPIIDEHLP